MERQVGNLIPPKELINIAENAIQSIIDIDLYNEMLKEEKRGIIELESFFEK
jgi:hypothetical protein